MDKASATAVIGVGGLAGFAPPGSLLSAVIFAGIGWFISVIAIRFLNDKLPMFSAAKIVMFGIVSVLLAVVIDAQGVRPPVFNIALVDGFFEWMWALPENTRCFLVGLFIPILGRLPSPERLFFLLRALSRKGATK